MTPSEIGERAEAAVLAALVSAGKQVLLPFGGQRRYDLAYEEDGRLVKVQCKSGRERGGAVIFQTYSVGRGPARDYRDDVDVFGVYCHERDEVYLVPVDQVPSRCAHPPAPCSERPTVGRPVGISVPPVPTTGPSRFRDMDVLVLALTSIDLCWILYRGTSIQEEVEPCDSDGFGTARPTPQPARRTVITSAGRSAGETSTSPPP